MDAVPGKGEQRGDALFQALFKDHKIAPRQPGSVS
jgi:hypothetical protein